MTIYLRFGLMGKGAERISNEISCTTARQAAVLACNIARVSGKFNENAHSTDQWVFTARTTRIGWESSDKTYFVELIKL